MSSERYAVIGDPIDHSLSPVMQRAAFASAGIEASYERLHVSKSQLPSAVQSLREQGYRGFNVTVPHKQGIMRLLDDLDVTALRVGAVNTVVRRGERLVGYNTDVEGFVSALDTLRQGRAVSRALVLGAGGAARAVVTALIQRQVKVSLLNRSTERARRLAEDIGGEIAVVDGAEAFAALLHMDLLVNATSVGVGDAANLSPLPGHAVLSPQTMVMDLVYGRVTPLLEAARRAGCRTQDGVEMLVAQGAAAFRLWTGIEPDVEAMRRVCVSRLIEAVT